MRVFLIAAAFVLLSAPWAPAQAQPRAFDPRSYHGRHVGEATQVLVLASPHLSGTPENWDPGALAPLLARLQAFQPDAIAIEALPGRTISHMWQYRETYPDVAHDYGGRAMVLAALARNTLNLDMPDAEAEMRRTLATWPDAPTAAQRRRLAALFCAAGDPASALVQWWRLDPSERIADDSVSRLLAEQLATYETPARRNENYLIGSRLGADLGLERVYPMDDQSDDIADPAFAQNFENFLGQPWFPALLADARFAPLREAGQHLGTPEEALATYRMLNMAATGRTDADMQWLSMINRESPGNSGRMRVAAWETRNLRMAANIREVATLHPGGRVLVIVGSGHKPWLDAYLAMMSDIEIVDATRVLR
ncbi:DUF5694 domain-containing protein [Terricaulis sp.]|uniref:DUF5694 domain-containing protein n=1 Tax=Terricaulis sp. TaxID=2768686 RepID=UPI00378371B1